VNGERRLTPKEMLRLQGFPDNYKITCSDTQIRKQAGNSLPVPVAKAVIKNVLEACWLNTYSKEKIEKDMTAKGPQNSFEESFLCKNSSKTKTFVSS
jgi:hypothetical protein